MGRQEKAIPRPEPQPAFFRLDFGLTLDQNQPLILRLVVPEAVGRPLSLRENALEADPRRAEQLLAPLLAAPLCIRAKQIGAARYSHVLHTSGQ